MASTGIIIIEFFIHPPLAAGNLAAGIPQVHEFFPAKDSLFCLFPTIVLIPPAPSVLLPSLLVASSAVISIVLFIVKLPSVIAVIMGFFHPFLGFKDGAGTPFILPPVILPVPVSPMIAFIESVNPMIPVPASFIIIGNYQGTAVAHKTPLKQYQDR